MALRDGAGLRQATAGNVIIQITKGRNPVDLSGGRAVTVDCKLNGGALGGVAVTTTTKVSIDGVEAAGASGWVEVDFSAANLNAPGTLTIEATITGSPTINPNEHVIQVPIRAPHSDLIP